MFLLNFAIISLLITTNSNFKAEEEQYLNSLNVKEYMYADVKKKTIYVKIPTPLVKKDKKSN